MESTPIAHQDDSNTSIHTQEFNKSKSVGSKYANTQKQRVYHQIAASCLGAVLTSISMTPFDVVKTRLQSGFIVNSNETTLRAMIKISGKEGYQSLWRGLTPTLALTLPQTAVYFVVYEKLKDGIITELYTDSYAPAISGILARSFAVTLTNPIELVRTRVQAGNESLGSVLTTFSKMIKNEGFSTLGRGLGTTLLRDAPFSAIYWSCIEFFKFQGRRIIPQRSYLQDLGISFLAGSVSGVVAATATHPFDVLKTILQVSAKPDTNRPAWKQVYITRGFAGFWVGLFPRIAKAAPACGIMISSYELGKRYLGELSS